MLRTRARGENSGTRGLGRLVEPDAHLLTPQMRPWSKAVVHDDDRTVSISWCRGVAIGLHSIAVEYDRDSVRIGTRMGTRPAFADKSGYVVLRMIVEHAVVRLREPLRGRSLEPMTTEGMALTRTR